MGNKEGMNLQEVLTFSTGEGFGSQGPYCRLRPFIPPHTSGISFFLYSLCLTVSPLPLPCSVSSVCAVSLQSFFTRVFAAKLTLGSQTRVTSSSRHWSPCSQCPPLQRHRRGCTDHPAGTGTHHCGSRQEACGCRGTGGLWISHSHLYLLYPSCHTWPGAMS